MTSSALSILPPADHVDSGVGSSHGTDSALSSNRTIPFLASRSDLPGKAHEVVQTKPVSPNPASTSAVADLEHFERELDADKVLLVPPGVTINGNIDTNGLASLIISGTVNGNVTAGSGTVIVRESGVVIGTINSDECVVVAGKVTGDKTPAIVTKGLWMLAETGQVRGDVAYSRQRAYEGGIFSGRAIPFAEYQG